MNDYELIMVVLGIISLAIACLGLGVKIGSNFLSYVNSEFEDSSANLSSSIKA